ncbi:MAG: hypothetical protein CME36_17420 [unclassified Hahellaceae]|nr:hypothetical protein [Hahellaceae bacterium]|tara:strand:- start:10958 stop:13537 length:2580 start_codon:yes stop_codon:yes gene_type:complete
MQPNITTLTRAIGFAAFLPVLFSAETVFAATPTGLTLDKSTHQTIGGRGDNWTLTWAKDGSTLVTMDDGNWFSDTANTYSHTVYRINYPSSTSSNFSMSNVSRLSNYPTFSYKKSCSFGYGLLAVDGVIYSMVSRCEGVNWNQFYGMKLLKSYDNGSTWYRVDKNGGEDYMGAWDSERDSRDSSEYFFYKGNGVTHWDSAKGNVTYYPFVYNTFVQAGKDYQHGLQRDGYIYIYSPDPSHASKVNMARVKHYDIGVRANWEYFTRYDSNGNPQWTKDINQRGVAYSLRRTDSNGNPISWYSGLPDIVYNPGLGKYIMVNGGMYAKTYNGLDAGKNNGSGSLTFYSSDNPYGPWKEFKHIDHFTATSSTERTYQPKLDPKNMSSDGRQMNLIWSDHAGPFATKYYTFNQMKINLSVGSDGGGSTGGGSGGGTTGGTTTPPASGPVKVTASSVEAEALTLSGYSVEGGSSGSVVKVASSSHNGTGSLSMIFGRASGNYDVNVRVLAENDGQSTLKLYVNGKYIATKTFPKVANFATLSFGNVAINSGDTVKIVGQKDGYATFARVDSIAFAAAGGTSTPAPTEPTGNTGGSNGGSTATVVSSIEAETMSLSGFSVEQSSRIKVSSSAANASGSAKATFNGNSGSYTVNIDAIAEDDGQSTIELHVGGKLIGAKRLSRVARDETLAFTGVYIAKGQELKIVGHKDGYATFARIDRVRIESGGSTSQPAPTPTPTEPTSGEGSSSMEMEAESMALSGYGIESNARIAVSSSAHNGTGFASFTSKVKSGTYTLGVKVLAEDDGQSKVSLYVDGAYMGQQSFPRVVGYRTLNFTNVALKYGQTIKLVGQKDGYATRARIDKINID